MLLTRVTLSGLDKNTNLAKIWRISKLYPLTEWGISFDSSSYHDDTIVNYKTLLELIEFKDKYKINCILQVSSKTVHGFLNNRFDISKVIKTFPRIQLNINQIEHKVNIEQLHAFMCRTNKQIIIPYNFSNLEITEAINLENHYPIFDNSLGNGIEIKSFYYLNYKNECGYAGGINLDNVEIVLKSIYLVARNRYFWISIQKYLKDSNNNLDVEKAEAIMERIKTILKT